MKIQFYLIALLLWVAPFAQAQTTCLDDTSIMELKQTFTILRWDGESFNQLPAGTICDTDGIVYNLFESLLLLKNLSDINDDSSLVGTEGPMSFFKNRIQKIVIEDVPMSKTCEKDTSVAYVKNKIPNTTFICAKAFNLSDTFSRAAFLIHEARHVDGYDHVDCTHGDMFIYGAGDNACDTTFEEQGSYGIEAGFDVLIAKNSLNPLHRQQARANAVDLLLNRFNRYPWDLEAGLMAQDFSDSLSFINSKGQIPLNITLPAGAILTSRILLPTFYSANAEVKTYSYTPQQWVDTAGSLAVDFREGSNLLLRDDLLAVKYGNNYSCMLFKSYLKCEDDNAKIIEFKKIKPKTLLLTQDVEAAAVLIDENGVGYKLPSKITEGSWTEKDLKKSTPAITVISTVNFDGLTYGLSNSHQLLDFSVSRNKWLEVPAFKGQYFKNIVPHIWSKQLEEL